ncbi:MAG TPA: cytochrome c3 family protein [Coriobacteriia bacterium]
MTRSRAGASDSDPLAKYRPGGPGASRTRSRTANRRRAAAVAVVLVGAVAFAWGWNPPTDGVHTFTEASDYRPARDAGCTNSGKGCHGSETAYSDFHDYHKDTPCTTCHDYQGVGCIPCHKSRAAECVDCHDGTMRGAPNVAKLAANYPRGHYRETTHTATGTDWKAEVRAVAGGKAKAACGDCHSRDLKKAHTDVPEAQGTTYGRDLSCGECHNDTRSFGLDVVLSDWKGRRCEDCHTEKSSSPAHGAVAGKVKGASPLKCGSTGSGCHESDDLHALHPDSPKDCSGTGIAGELACHKLKVESHEPTVTACAGQAEAACHRGYLNDRYGHKKDRTLHSPETYVPARDTSYYGTACGDCHRMDPDGTSLVDEHALATSARTRKRADGCRNCHDHEASAEAIAEDWSDRDNAQVCSVCHGAKGLPEAHAGDFTGLHTKKGASVGCASTGPGCHPVSDLSQVGKPTVCANIHATCLRCHDWRTRGRDLAYDPGKKTCGSGRDCHASARSYEPSSSVHAGAGGLANGVDADHHTAGPAQGATLWVDPSGGNSTACEACHSMVLGVEHSRSTSTLSAGPDNLCVRCHDGAPAAAGTVKSGWASRSSAAACASCHGRAGVPAIHGAIVADHVAVQRDPGGSASADACVRSGCHATGDLRRLHGRVGCGAAGCHETAGRTRTSRVVSCGGADAPGTCHPGYSATQHFVSHYADRAGAVGGITYDVGSNQRCFGCHFRDLVSEHATALVNGEGGGATPCAVCHYGADDPGSGRYASLRAVRGAIAAHDVRCVACHASGNAADGPAAVASAHKRVSATEPLPPGTVASDPFDDWRAAFSSPTGGGHNSLTATAVGAPAAKDFPVTEYVSNGTTYTWSLMPNTGSTTWLREDVFGAAALATADSIRRIRVGCDDCHLMPAGMAGPQGASVKVSIDPAYSQTEYAEPSPLVSQFSTTGTQRVVCFKCHTIQAGSVPGTSAPGGHRVHAAHDEHADFPDYNPVHYGEKCIDCHVRIPHAWKHQRLLIRTVVTTDGVEPDAYPYVKRGHDGLAGIVLKNILVPADLRSRYCVNGGCHGRHSATSHPTQSDVPTAALWP